ncbi:methyltransferase domain-containing protein [Phenylobacterium sp.]|uniref:class I SAM-dependent methyltransferase n=1 Tax=Phenylobacterium sp. TaxID=1871053 RepID=UPI0025F5981B|nr:methyltransferase domain-containing protein [Phenylobacterium sp.]
MAVLTYRPQIFDAPDLKRAREIIMTPEPDISTDERWERETPYMTAIAQAHLMPGPGDTVVDYGCGIGRLSKTLIERSGCNVLGVDISASMRAMAIDYVGSPNFQALSPEAIAEAVAGGLRVDGAMAIWVIQHVLDPRIVVDLLATSLKPEATLFVVNTLTRCVPTVEKFWARDSYDVRALLKGRLKETSIGTLDPKWAGRPAAEYAFWALYRTT